ncbi:PREDICTED: centrosomal protein of 135 kDa-like isoform X2 [Thamnophis sirtalis]|uniref:Centrosomal protein of 135 kDa-like isoform X2 n=1 Tax=Thamnophis sirtalis TaxID=35019 RepID=A0A6I9XPC3_9SAUR|nr:PREDICTED: centrosomal protein of 135 kDa-like isoform X2 [Thamnophis sirtalis]XP_013915843.1 PREDICTED: centrosomal protein of 135 kDa-like isoform X2 [Thamnophis sirtalis]
MRRLISSTREKAKKATHIPPKVTRKATKLLQTLKELEATINRTEIDIAKKENSTKHYETETQAIHKRLQVLSDASAKEKLLLMEEVTKLKKMLEHSTQDISHKEAELLKIQREMQETVNSVKEKEHAVCLLESKCQQKIWQYQDMEKNLSELRSQCTQLQALLYRLEEKLSTRSQSAQETIVKELSEEAEKLRQILKENKLSADEDKYLLNKMAEDCGHLTKENSVLHAQIQKATKHLNQERQLREEETTSYSRSVSELTSGREKTWQLKRKLTHLKTLLQNLRQKVLKAQEQLLHLQERKSTDHKRQHLHTQLIHLENQHIKVQLENSKLRTEKNHWVEHISQIHKQIAENHNEISFLHSHVYNLSCDLNNLKSEVNMPSIPQKGKVITNTLTTNCSSMN